MASTWNLQAADLEALAIGAAILGTGGGGSPYLGKLEALEMLRKGYPLSVLPFDEMRDDDWLISVGTIGAPVAGVEKINKGDECYKALRAVESLSQRQATAVLPAEIGGSNSIQPLIAAAYAGLPTLDADGMGRAFPEVQMSTFFIYGHLPYPAAVADEKGNTVLLGQVSSMFWLEKLARTACVDFGATAGFALPPMSGAFLRQAAVPHTLTQAIALGKAVMDARIQHRNPVEEVLERENGVLLFKGKVTDISRQIVKGFARGQAQLIGLEEFAGSEMVVDIQNENLIARREGVVVASVPDLISILDLESGEPTTTETLRFGFRVAVIGLPAHPLLKTAQALEVIGPPAFGYDGVEFQPLARQ